MLLLGGECAMLAALLVLAACSDGSVIEPRRWF